MYVVKIDREIMWNFCDAQFGILSFRSKGDEDLRILGPIQLSEKEAKKSLNCPPKKSYPSQPPALSWQRHSLVVSTIFVTSMVVSFFSHLGIAEKTDEVVCWWQNEPVGFDLRIKKNRHKATRLNLNLGDIFFSAKQNKQHYYLPNFTGAKLRQGFLLYIFPKKTTAWIFQQKLPPKIDGHFPWAQGICRVALPHIQPSGPGFFGMWNLSNEKGALLVGWRVSAW